jgi:hypothetical protein
VTTTKVVGGSPLLVSSAIEVALRAGRERNERNHRVRFPLSLAGCAHRRDEEELDPRQVGDSLRKLPTEHTKPDAEISQSEPCESALVGANLFLCD